MWALKSQCLQPCNSACFFFIFHMGSMFNLSNIHENDTDAGESKNKYVKQILVSIWRKQKFRGYKKSNIL